MLAMCNCVIWICIDCRRIIYVYLRTFLITYFKFFSPWCDVYLQFSTAAQYDLFPIDAMQMLVSGSEISSMTCSVLNNCYIDIITISGYFLFTPVYNTVISIFIIIFSKYICSLHHVIERGKHCLCWWIQTHDVILVADVIFKPLLILFKKNLLLLFIYFVILFLFHSLISNIVAIFQALNLYYNDVFVWWCSSCR